jgi:hypothetical protein
VRASVGEQPGGSASIQEASMPPGKELKDMAKKKVAKKAVKKAVKKAAKKVVKKVAKKKK